MSQIVEGLAWARRDLRHSSRSFAEARTTPLPHSGAMASCSFCDACMHALLSTSSTASVMTHDSRLTTHSRLARRRATLKETTRLICAPSDTEHLLLQNTIKTYRKHTVVK